MHPARVVPVACVAALLAASALLCSALACSDALGPPYGDPARYALVDSVQYACGGWSPARPAAAVGLFDVYYGSLGEGPTADDRRLIARARGEVVTPFHVRGARVVVPVAEVPRLAASLVVGVAEPARLDHRVFVGVQAVGDSLVVLERGGSIVRAWPSITAVYAILADSAIPALRADARVRYVEAEGVACAQAR